MGRRAEVHKLPFEVRRELDARLREAVYGDYVALSDWIEEKGFTVSKSALHRYGTALRQADAGMGNAEAQVAQAMRQNGGAMAARRDGLLIELGRLRLREHQLLAEITALDTGMVPDNAPA